LKKRNDEYHELAAYLDRHADGWVAGVRAALANAPTLAHPGSAERVMIAIMRCLMVKARGIPALKREIGVADSNDRRSFGSYQQVFDGWHSNNERAFAHRLASLAALEGHEQKTEAA
jgi:hypothetical protein